MSGKADGFGHEAPYEGESNDWITPKGIIDAFDKYARIILKRERYFDLDPCASVTQPWPCALESYTEKQNGLITPWHGTVYCNPPYGPHTSAWIRRLADYGNGIALVFARVETKLWQDEIFPTASGFVFPRGRIQFSRPNGTTPSQSSGAPSALIAWGEDHRDALIALVDNDDIPGAFFGMAFYTESHNTWSKEDTKRIRQEEQKAKEGWEYDAYLKGTQLKLLEMEAINAQKGHSDQQEKRHAQDEAPP